MSSGSKRFLKFLSFFDISGSNSAWAPCFESIRRYERGCAWRWRGGCAWRWRRVLRPARGLCGVSVCLCEWLCVRERERECVCVCVCVCYVCVCIHVCSCMYVHVHTCCVLTNPPIPSWRCKDFAILRPAEILLRDRGHPRGDPCQPLK